MTKWSLLVERPSLRGTVAFHDTGRTFETTDAAAAHAYVMAEQGKDGRSYAAAPFKPGLLRRLFGLG